MKPEPPNQPEPSALLPTPRTKAAVAKGQSAIIRECIDLERELASARAESAELRRDKERLDWLEKNEDHSVFFEPGDPDVGCFSTWVVSKGRLIYAFHEGSLRHTIDAASAPKQAGEKGKP